MQGNNAVLLPLDSEETHGRPMNLIDMLLKHEERIQDIESGMDRLSTLTQNTNHHLANMRTSLVLLESITLSVDKIKDSVSKSETDLKIHKTATDKDIKYITKQIDSIGPWVKWGFGTILVVMSLFVTVSTTLKIWGG